MVRIRKKVRGPLRRARPKSSPRAVVLLPTMAPKIRSVDTFSCPLSKNKLAREKDRRGIMPPKAQENRETFVHAGDCFPVVGGQVRRKVEKWRKLAAESSEKSIRSTRASAAINVSKLYTLLCSPRVSWGKFYAIIIFYGR